MNRHLIPNLLLWATLLGCPMFFSPVHAQVLHTESFVVILDTSRIIRGNINPQFNYQNLKRDILEISNAVDVAIGYRKHSVTIANRTGLTRYGKETLLSGGFIYAEYHWNMNKKLAMETHHQFHWKNPRGMETKYAAGVNFRWKILNDISSGLYVGTGPFYEFERWNYDGVPEEKLPAVIVEQEASFFKWNTYVSLKFVPLDQLLVDVSVYHQSTVDQFFSGPRLAASSRLIYSFTRSVGIQALYQNVYDPNPFVPIDRLYHFVSIGLNFTF